MSVLICKVTGTRGRRIAVYDNKCVITTDASLGSILTSNALDGQKTVFYIDIVGVQFKKSGLTLGYLQFETSSLQMNNASSNMFSENTFTFDVTGGNISNHLVECIHDYIVDRIESYKYNTPAQDIYLQQLVSAANNSPACQMNYAVSSQVKKELQEQAQKREEENAEKKRAEYEAREKAAEELRRSVQDKGNVTQYELFLLQASTCKRVAEVQTLWNSFPWDKDATALIEGKIKETAQIERMYGSNPNRVQKLLDEIKKML